MIKKIFLLLMIFQLSVVSAFSNHLLGGEITWDCQANGQFVFTMKLYRDCNNIAGPINPALEVHNHPTLSSIPLSLITTVDISATGPGCSTCVSGGVGATQEIIYRSNPITLSGIPPIGTGWVFTYDDCCRNGIISNLVNPGSAGFTLRAIMYPYNGQNTNPCYDSSPSFTERPVVVMCTGNPFTFNHNTIDKDLDSLVYEWGRPLNNFTGAFNNLNPAALPFATGYTYTSPLPGPAQDPSNIAAVMNPNNGVVSFTSFTPGNFVTVTRVRAYKCGQLVAEIYREIPITLFDDCTITPGVYNTAPSVTAPFQDPLTGLYTSFSDTIFASDTVSFFMSSTDFESLPAAVGGGPQVLTINASGQQFGAGFTNVNTGCPDPPCATLSPVPPISAMFGAGITFKWITDCDQVSLIDSCFHFSNPYQFFIRVADNFCPAPAINMSTISVILLPPPVVPAPDLYNVSILSNGNVQLNWFAPADIPPIDTNKFFVSYEILYATSANGPWTVQTSINNINTLMYIHVGANALVVPGYYRMLTRSNCNNISDTTVAKLAVPTGVSTNHSPGNKIRLSQNFPNPFDSETKIQYYIPQPGSVTFEIRNPLGQLIFSNENKSHEKGEFELVFNSGLFHPGSYFYYLKFEDQLLVKKLILIN